MAKVNRSLIDISGKIGDSVFVQRRGSEYVRKAPKPGSKKDEPVLKYQYKRTRLLNKLASELNSVIKTYRRHFKGHDFYVRLQSLFRKEPSDNRFMLLSHLKDMEINTRYKSEKQSFYETSVSATKKNITVNFEILQHPSEIKFESDCYYYELILVTWDKSKKAPKHFNTLTVWIDKSKGMPEFEFEFPNHTGVTNWLLCVYRRLGITKVEIENFLAESMLITDVGTFDKKEQALFNKKNKEGLEKPSLRRKIDTEERVKPKRIK
jgi:hypothetical protein